ncbi:M61 family metallopeptidase [Nibribacter ruber]|uniref:M61 family metallopeptidase n=1 Tax=Nibribacter ruber TaxID=2698458 RepID=UPI003741F5E5
MLLAPKAVQAQGKTPQFQYTISFPKPASHTYHIDLNTGKFPQDTLLFKMPNWMPGYYQLMDYAKGIENLVAKDEKGRSIPLTKVADNAWRATGVKNKPLRLSYDIKTSKQFVANSYVDSAHAYLIPGNSFLYVDGLLNTPVSVSFQKPAAWKNLVTGLEPVVGKATEFTAPDFDILYDCPILMGNLEELPSFKVGGVEHRFIGYQMGEFDKVAFMGKLKKVVEAAVAVIGDIPFKQYTFIGIGPGQGGIEHLNNTTVSFNGKSLTTAASTNRMMNFLAHEYFHHYNAKRIRPLELGPFDYDQGSKTNLLWVNEGLTVYYDNLIVKRAGLADAETLLSNFNAKLNAVENNPGKRHQSLVQASYNTWKDGPFGTQGEDPNKAISYYDKGPLVGLLLDFEIRHATQNKKSLDDVMRQLYWQYYKKAGRGFTDAEFQQTCETIAGKSLASLFEYVYTTKELDYATYLGYAGLKLETKPGEGKQALQYKITHLENPTAQQKVILQSWLGE